MSQGRKSTGQRAAGGDDRRVSRGWAGAPRPSAEGLDTVGSGRRSSAMILPPVEAAASSDRSLIDWSYNVSKTVGSTAILAVLVAAVGKRFGWATFVRIRWSALAMPPSSP